jgi:predicted anti-sigma-YlaC factor YlaD
VLRIERLRAWFGQVADLARQVPDRSAVSQMCLRAQDELALRRSMVRRSRLDVRIALSLLRLGLRSGW